METISLALFFPNPPFLTHLHQSFKGQTHLKGRYEKLSIPLTSLFLLPKAYLLTAGFTQHPVDILPQFPIMPVLEEEGQVFQDLPGLLPVPKAVHLIL